MDWPPVAAGGEGTIILYQQEEGGLATYRRMRIGDCSHIGTGGRGTGLLKQQEEGGTGFI